MFKPFVHKSGGGGDGGGDGGGEGGGGNGGGGEGGGGDGLIVPVGTGSPFCNPKHAQLSSVASASKPPHRSPSVPEQHRPPQSEQSFPRGTILEGVDESPTIRWSSHIPLLGIASVLSPYP